MKVSAQNIGVTLSGHPVLSDVDLEVRPGEVVGLLGPNGSGKSTLLRTIYRAIRPDAGAVHLGDLDVWSATTREVARRCAVLTQDNPSEVELNVLDVVLLGRIPHRSLTRRSDREDLPRARDCLAEVGALHLEDRLLPTLSGGERQRVMLARALAQEPQVLLLDEPTNHLDIAHQLDLLSLVRRLGVTAIVALHDLTLAAAYCDRLALLDRGRLVTVGPPGEVLTPERVQAVYGVACDVLVHPRTGRLLLALTQVDSPELPSPGLESSAKEPIA
ncbi:ABC transporter related protein [Kribbella flavida DSM 17836]|uniref:ABC transporter related protein n=1 Tax=Kribbella flavida (strain DSM 17836 / JCM 10339 / NBRC 14399) TaxID=479435 RepID=D2PWM0_KRIFD|nr:ABC transporter ATP-binding protein [Kribbella flavida]ADB33489.1 ABC transporter related protein [Kribbella flavida DSM 17836]